MATPSKTGVALSLAATGLACTPTAPTPPEPAASVVPPAASASTGTGAPATTDTPVASAAPDPDRALALLRPLVVLHDRVARTTLYTWTTRAQIDELAAKRVLLTRSASPANGPSFFRQVIAARAASGDRLAVLLNSAPFARNRFAWPSPWATLVGWPGESYGEQLIQVTLKEGAWIAKVFQSRPGIEVVDHEERPVAIDQVIAHPERLAAAYFVHDLPDRGGATTFAGSGARPAYREYVLCNEAMIERWALGTEDIARTVDASVSALVALQESLRRRSPPMTDTWTFNRRVATKVWTGEEPAEAPERVFEAALAFPHERYVPTLPLIGALIQRLRALPAQTPMIEHRPNIPLPNAIPSAAALPPAPPPPSGSSGSR